MEDILSESKNTIKKFIFSKNLEAESTLFERNEYKMTI